MALGTASGSATHSHYAAVRRIAVAAVTPHRAAPPRPARNDGGSAPTEVGLAHTVPAVFHAADDESGPGPCCLREGSQDVAPEKGHRAREQTEQAKPQPRPAVVEPGLFGHATMIPFRARDFKRLSYSDLSRSGHALDAPLIAGKRAVPWCREGRTIWAAPALTHSLLARGPDR